MKSLTKNSDTKNTSNTTQNAIQRGSNTKKTANSNYINTRKQTMDLADLFTKETGIKSDVYESQSPLATPFRTCEGACGAIYKSNWLISQRGI